VGGNLLDKTVYLLHVYENLVFLRVLETIL
jgi:hypothetical protein